MRSRLADLELFQYADTPEDAFSLLKAGLITNHLEPESRHAQPADGAHPPEPPSDFAPDIAKTR